MSDLMQNVGEALNGKTHRALCDLLRTLGNGKIGTDPARATKADLVQYAVETYGVERLGVALSFGVTAAQNGATPSNQPLPPALPETVPADSDQEYQEPAHPPVAAYAGDPLPTVPLPAKKLAKAPAVSASDKLAEALRELIPASEAVVDEAVVEAIARRVMNEAGAVPHVLDVRCIERPEGTTVEGQHPLFEKVLRLASAGVNVLLVGPAGCGKTHLAEQVAAALGRDFGALSLTAGTTESALVGRLLPGGEHGRFIYVESPFVRLYANGGVFLFDELDAADPNMLLVVNSALANGHIEIEQRAISGLATRIERHATSLLLGAANTYGTGASAQYVGRGALDAATVDRWYVVEMGYDMTFEARLFGGSVSRTAAWQAASDEGVEGDVAILGAWVQALREKAVAAGLKRVVSSRMIQKAVMARRAGVPVAEIKSDLLAGWSADEKAAVGA